jgi:hypothetical protein
MAMRIQKVQVWAAELRDEPGGLADVLSAVANAGGSLDCVLARRDPSKPGMGEVFVTPIEGNQRLLDQARSAGLGPAANLGTLRIEGSDRSGLGAEITQAIAAAGINLRGVTAVTAGRNFVAYFGFDTDTDADAAAQALRGMAGTSGRAAGGGRGGRGRTSTKKSSKSKSAKKASKKSSKKTTKRSSR